MRNDARRRRAVVELATVYCEEEAAREMIDEVIEEVRGCVERVELHFGGQASPLFLVSLE